MKTKITWHDGKVEELERNSSNTRMSIYLPEELKHLVAYEAHRRSMHRGQRVSMSEVVIDALESYLVSTGLQEESDDHFDNRDALDEKETQT